jgi:arsenate reductase
MIERIVIYHNPRCSKSRATLELLGTQGIRPEVVHYLETPPDAATLDRLLGLLDLQPRQLMRTREAAYRDHGLDDPALTRQQLIEAMVRWPQLIERPIVVRGNRAALGRPPEKVLDILRPDSPA